MISIKKKLSELNAFTELKLKSNNLAKEAEGLDAENLVALIEGEKWKKYFWIKQVKSEIIYLSQIIEKKKPKIVLEIGTANGGSLFLFTKLSLPNALIISIDLPAGEFGGGYTWDRKGFYRSFASKNQQIQLLREDSHSTQTLEKIKTILSGRKIDFLFIDGDHTYEGAKKDFNQYQSLVDEKGIIAFHDIAKHPESWGVEVDRFWNEIKTDYEWTEIIEDKNQGWGGIGVLYNKEENET